MDGNRFAPCRLYLGTEDGLLTGRLTPDGIGATADKTAATADGVGQTADGVEETVGGSEETVGGFEETTRTLSDNAIRAIAVHPADPDRAFAATGSGLYRSDDAGESW